MSKVITNNLYLWSSAILNRSTVGRGSNGKQEAYGIRKLRELILELAVRGKLVEQDHNDVPASELLKNIAAKKEKLTKEGKIKKKKPQAAITKNDELFDIPQKWVWVRFGDIAEHNAGKTLDRGRNTGEPKDYITTSNLYWGRFDLTDVRQMLIREDELEKCTARNGDLLICEGGEAGRAAVWDKDYEVCFQNHVHRARFYCDIDPFYAYRYFEQLCATGELDNYRKGVGISNMSGKALASIPFPLPPKNMQHRIVTKVGELMALCDQLEQQQSDSIDAHQTLVETLLSTLINVESAAELAEAWSRIADHFDTLFTTEHSIDQLKQTILQLAVMGKLVPKDHSDKPASVLLEKIAKEKERLIKEKKIKKQKVLPAISEDEKYYELPDGWEWSRIGDASISTDYGLSDKASLGGDGVPVFAMGHIQSGQVILDADKTVPVSVDSLPELYLKNRDLLYNRTNSAELVGKTGIFRGNDDEYTFASYLIRIRTDKDSLLPEFLNLTMLTPLFRKTQIVPHLKQQCGQANVNGTIMKNMIVAIPPEKEMQAIITKVDQLMRLCDSLKAHLVDIQTTQINLADAVVEQAVA